MSELGTVIATTDTNAADEFLLRQGTVDRKQIRTKLSEGVVDDILSEGFLDNTVTQKGVVQKATQTDMNTGTNNDLFITPLLFRDTKASTSAYGITRLALNTEAINGTSTALAVTPANLSARTATTSITGLIKLATLPEVEAGTSSTLAVTPKTLRDSRSGLTTLATSITSSGISTLTEDWDNFLEIIIVADISGGQQKHYTFYTDLISPSDSTTTMKYYLGAFDDFSSFNFRNTNRNQLYFLGIGDDDSVVGVYGKVRS